MHLEIALCVDNLYFIFIIKKILCQEICAFHCYALYTVLLLYFVPGTSLTESVNELSTVYQLYLKTSD